MIMGNPPRMLTAQAVKEAGVGSVFINPYGEVFRLTVAVDGDHHYLRPVVSGGYVPAHELAGLYGPHGVQGVAVGLRLVYKAGE